MGTRGATISNFQHLSPASRQADPQPPYLITRVEFDHISPLPQELSSSELRLLAREQAKANKLPTYLVIAPDISLYLSPSAEEFLVSDTPPSLLIVSGYLRLVQSSVGTEQNNTRKKEFVEWAKRTLEGCTRQAACLGLNGQARAVSALVQRDFGGKLVAFQAYRHHIGQIHRSTHRWHGIPGLRTCATCGERSGSCTATQGSSGETRTVPVLCRCANDNLCAACGTLLAERKLGSIYFAEESQTLKYYPGYRAFAHRCPELHRKE